MKAVRINPSMLAVARDDELGRVAAPMLFAGAGAAVGLVAAPRAKKSPTASALVGVALGLGLYYWITALEKRR